MRKLRRTLTLTFTLCALLFLLPAFFLAAHLHHAGTYMHSVTGVITEFSGNVPIIRYTVDGVEYQVQGSVSSTSQQVGNAYPLLVDPDAPARTVDPGLRVLVWVFGGIGGIMLAVTIIMNGTMSASERRIKALRDYGHKVPATVTSVRENRSISVGRQHPMVVEAHCSHPVTMEDVRLKTTLWQTALRPGDQVDALFDPMDEKKYALDLMEKDATPS